MSSESISVWSVITVVMLPLLGGAFLLLWSRMDKHQDADKSHHDDMWKSIHEIQNKLEHHRVDSERRFVEDNDLRKLEERLDGRLERIEDKLDALRPKAS